MSNYTPEVILVQILNLLPPKSLLRFRCVCKRWKEIIDSPAFMLDHLAVQKPLFLIYSSEPDFVVADPRTSPLVRMIRSPIEKEEFCILGTLHGVVCLYDWDNNIWLWNPSICKFSSIPLPLDFGSAFENSFEHCYGFWIDPSNKDFKIIILLYDFDYGNPIGVNGILYSSVRHGWSAIPPEELGTEWVPSHTAPPGPPVMIGGVAHWRGCYEFGDGSTNAILAFDFTQESFEFMAMPNLNYSDPEKEAIPCQWQGTLSVLCWLRTIPCRCDIYSRQEGSWAKLFSFNLLPPVTESVWVRLLGETEERFWVLAETLHHTLSIDEIISKPFLYDSRVGCVPLEDVIRFCSVAYEFVESLLFP